jgi:hypothetical protein
MKWAKIFPWKWHRYLVAILIIAFAAALRLLGKVNGLL